jgi:hypothetical protein
MNYEKIYNQIIERAQTRILKEYKERHHIIPKCMGGMNNKENLVNLTAREHFICHWLLVRIYPDNHKLKQSFWCMCYLKGKSKKRYTPSSRAYNEAKELQSNYMRNRVWSDETRLKISNKVKGVPKSELAKENMSKAKKGTYIPWNKGKHHSAETIIKMKESRRIRAERERNNLVK